MSSDLDELYVELLSNEYDLKWAFLMDWDFYFNIMRSLSHCYRIYLDLSRFKDPANKHMYWNELLHYVFDFHTTFVMDKIAMEFIDFIEMTNFCMTVDLALEYRRERLLFRDVLSTCLEL